MICCVRSKAPKLGTARRSLFATLPKVKAKVVADVALSTDEDVNVCFLIFFGCRDVIDFSLFIWFDLLIFANYKAFCWTCAA